jgi:hypothetical protein
MLLQRIFSDRHYQNWPSWQIVFEWEDQLAAACQLEIAPSPTRFLWQHKWQSYDNRKFGGRFHRWAHTLNPLKGSYTRLQPYSLYFEMAPRLYPAFSNHKHTLPVLIDFWQKEAIPAIAAQYKRCRYVLVTNAEVIQELQPFFEVGQLVHFPMSLPDKYHLLPNKTFDKRYDLVLSGRTNPVLWAYLQEFLVSYPDLEFLKQEEKQGTLHYISNKRGWIGEFQTRQAYADLLAASKVTFYATPGIDGGEARTAGFNPLTPRFFEMLAAGCHVLARYPATIETDWYDMKSVCPPVNDYETFKNQLLQALNSPGPVARNSAYLAQHYTSSRIPILKQLT